MTQTELKPCNISTHTKSKLSSNCGHDNNRGWPPIIIKKTFVQQNSGSCNLKNCSSGHILNSEFYEIDGVGTCGSEHFKFALRISRGKFFPTDFLQQYLAADIILRQRCAMIINNIHRPRLLTNNQNQIYKTECLQTCSLL